MGFVPFRQPSTLFCCCHLVLHIFCCIVENKPSLSLSVSVRAGIRLRSKIRFQCLVSQILEYSNTCEYYSTPCLIKQVLAVLLTIN